MRQTCMNPLTRARLPKIIQCFTASEIVSIIIFILMFCRFERRDIESAHGTYTVTCLIIRNE